MDEWTVIQELEKDVPDNWSVSSETVYEVMDKHKNEFFKLFSEYFFYLWHYMMLHIHFEYSLPSPTTCHFSKKS